MGAGVMHLRDAAEGYFDTSRDSWVCRILPVWRQHSEALLIWVEKVKQPSEILIPIGPKLEIDVEDFSD